MALIIPGKMSKADKSRINVHEAVEATYTIFNNDGITYFQIDTYGSDKREVHNKISQSIQFDKNTAKFLIDLLTQEMNINR